MENQTPQSEKQKPKNRKKWPWIVGGVILFFIIIVAVTPVPENQNENSNTDATTENKDIVLENTNQITTVSSNEENDTVVENIPSEEINTEITPSNINVAVEPPTNELIVLENINQDTPVSADEESEKIIIRRIDIINLFPDFDFSKESTVDGQENYLGISPNELSMVQLIGPENSLSEIALMYTMAPDVEQTYTPECYAEKLMNK